MRRQPGDGLGGLPARAGRRTFDGRGGSGVFGRRDPDDPHYRDALLGRFRLDESNPAAQLAMLDKLGTYRSAPAAGVPTPRFWIAESRPLESLREELVYPLIVKPRLAHKAKKTFRTKHGTVENFAELLAAFEADRAAAVDVLLMEWIPGGDDALCSYYTYLEGGTPALRLHQAHHPPLPTGMGHGAATTSPMRPRA